MDMGPHSDFVFYYRVVSDPSGAEYDLKVAVPAGDPRASGIVIDDFQEHMLNGPHIVCELGYLGGTHTLGGGS